jgi:hypothetical protein
MHNMLLWTLMRLDRKQTPALNFIQGNQSIILYPAVNNAASLPSLFTFTDIEHSPLPPRTLHVLSKVRLKAKGWRGAYFWFEDMPQGKCLSFRLRIAAKADNPARQVCLEGEFSKHLEKAEVLALRAFNAAHMAIGSRSASYLNLTQRTAQHSMQQLAVFMPFPTACNFSSTHRSPMPSMLHQTPPESAAAI